MAELTPEDLKYIATDTLELVAFVIAEECQGGNPEVALGVCIDYSGEGSVARLELAASSGFARELAANMLAVDEIEVRPEFEGVYALLELANIMAGQIVRHLGSETRPFRVGLPEVLGVSTLAGDADVECSLDSMGEPLFCRLRHMSGATP